MKNVDPNLMDAALDLKKTFVSLGMFDRAFTIDNIVDRAKKNIAAEDEIGTDEIEKTIVAIGNVSDRLKKVMSQRRVFNSDILAAIEDSKEDISIISENGDRCPDFVSAPANMLMNGISRVMGRMRQGGPSDNLRSDAFYILHRTIKGVSRYDDEE